MTSTADTTARFLLEFRSTDGHVWFATGQTSQSGLTREHRFNPSCSNSMCFFYFEISLISFRHYLSPVVLILVDTIFDCSPMEAECWIRCQSVRVVREWANETDRSSDTPSVQSSIGSSWHEFRTRPIAVGDARSSYGGSSVHRSIPPRQTDNRREPMAVLRETI